MSNESRDHRSAEALYRTLTAVVRQMPRDISLTSLATLSTLNRTGPRRITELAAVEGITQPSMTSLVTSLERNGLVERRKDATDGRVALIALTDAGRDLLTQRRRSGAERLELLIAKLSPADAEALAAAVPALDHLDQLDSHHRDPAQRPDTAPRT